MAGSLKQSPLHDRHEALGAKFAEFGGWTMPVGATAFAIASTIYSWLFLRARSVPRALALLGLAASLLLVVGLPLQATRILRGGFSWYMWIPMACFEIVLGAWLLVKGVRAPVAAQTTP